MALINFPYTVNSTRLVDMNNNSWYVSVMMNDGTELEKVFDGFYPTETEGQSVIDEIVSGASTTPVQPPIAPEPVNVPVVDSGCKNCGKTTYDPKANVSNSGTGTGDTGVA
jgi:hypothetical protein